MPAQEPLRIRFDAFELDEDDARVLRAGQPVPLTPKAFAVLCTLARHPGRLVTKDELLDAVWGHKHISDSVLKTTISSLRSALADDPKQPRFIETASRRGYRFIASDCTLAATAAPLPLQHTGMQGLIGRRRELEALHRAWADAQAGQRKLVWLCGDAGVGKTTLIDTFAKALDGERVAFGQCIDQFGSGEAYLPVLDVLASLSRSDPSLAALMRGFAPAWLAQLPWLCDDAERQRLRESLSQASSDRMLRELGELLDEYTHQQPLLIVLEDMHWSDHATVRLIDYLARRRTPARLLLAGTFRLAELAISAHPMRALRHELRLQKLCEELVLDPFSESEVGDFLSARTQRADVSEDVARAVHARTEGLPLFVDTLVQDLQAQGLLEGSRIERARREDAGIEWEIPESLAAVVEKRLERLPADRQQLLEAASVCGSEFPIRVLAGVLERDIEEVAAACEQLAAREYWLRHVSIESDASGALDAKYAFRHSLYRDVLYKRCSALRRASLHRRVGEALERAASSKGISTVELATHFELGQQPHRAIPHYLTAIDNAIARFAPREAVALGARAMDLLPLLPQGSAELTLAAAMKHALACAQCYGMSSDAARAAYARVQELCDIPIESADMAWVMNGIALFRFGRGEYEEAKLLGERILSFASSHGDASLHVAACNVHSWVAAVQGRHGDSIGWGEEGIRSCEAAGASLETHRFFVDPVVILHGVLAVEYAQAGGFARALSHAGGAQARGRDIGHPMAQALAQRCSAIVDMRLHEPARVLERARFLIECGAKYGGAQPAALGRLLGGWAQAQLGDPAAGVAQIFDGIRRLQAMGIASIVQPQAWAAEALVLSGDLAAARTQVDEAMASAERLGEAAALPDLLRIEAELERRQSNEVRAHALLRRAVDLARSQGAEAAALDAQAALCELQSATPADFARLGELLAARDAAAQGEWFERAEQLHARAIADPSALHT